MKNKEPRIIEIEVTAEDAANCGPFSDRDTCLIATATKRQCGIDSLFTNETYDAYSYKINGIWYSFEDQKRFILSHYRNSDGQSVDKPIVTAPFKVVLREII